MDRRLKWTAASALLVPFVALAEPTAERKPPIKWEGSMIVALDVKDVVAAKTWYHDVLGAESFYEFEGGGWIELKSPVEHALIGLSQAPPGEARGRGAVTLSLGVTNIEEARDFLVKKGVTVEPIEEIPQTVKLLHFTDPDGNRLMFHQPWKGEK